MSIKIAEYLVESLVGALLVLQLPVFDGRHAIKQGGVTRDEPPHLDESIHDADADLHCLLAPQHS